MSFCNFPRHSLAFYRRLSSRDYVLSRAVRLVTSDDKHEDNNNTLRTGTVKTFESRKSYGFIVMDDDEDDEKFAFVHIRGVKKIENNNGKLSPNLKRGMRVQFKLRLIEETSEKLYPKAYDVTLEGGKLVKPFDDNYIEKFSERSKARFGHIIFEIMDTVNDQQEMETRIVEAYEKVKKIIDERKEEVDRIEKLYAERD